jgi:hypothetical protein
MSILVFAIGLFGVAFILHCLVLRAAKRTKIRRALLGESGTVLGVFVIVFMIGAAVPLLCAAPAFYPSNRLEWLHVSIFYFAASLTYTGLFFPLLHGGSPSLTVVEFIDRAREKGRNRAEVQGILGADAFLNQRLQQMVVDDLLIEDTGTYRLTAKGRKIAALFQAMAAILNLREGG